MSTETNKAIVQETFAALNGRDLERVVANYSPDCRFNGWGPDTTKPLDVSGYKATMSALLQAFPDSNFPVGDILAEGDRVVVPHRFQGTHLAEFQGIPATGRSVDIEGIAIFRMSRDKAAELWLSADFMGLLNQLGVVPLG